MKARTDGNPKWKDIQGAYKLKYDVEDHEMYDKYVQDNSTNACYSCPNFSVKLQSEREKLLDEVEAILNIRKSYMEELFEELRDPAVARHSLQQIEIIRHKVNDLRSEQEQYCIWTEDGDGIYHTSCGDVFEFINTSAWKPPFLNGGGNAVLFAAPTIFMNGTPDDNHMKSCPYCGKLLRQIKDGK
jgi:hypothetical protein